MLKRVLVVAGSTIAVLAVSAIVLYGFGGMMPPPAEVTRAYAAEVLAGRRPAVEPRFVIPIPGCVCHADDPVLQVQHSVRRMNECGICHSRG